MSDSEELNEIPEDAGSDLFGETDDEDILPRSERGAGSDEDEAREGRGEAGDDDDEKRVGSDDDEDRQSVDVQNKVVESVEVQRHRVPKTGDGTLRSFRVPKFIRILPELYDRGTFEPTEADIANAKAENPKADIRVRKDPATGQLQSNALLHRWSDGSLTLSIGDEHFEVSSKMLAPPLDKAYQELQDGHYYAAAPNLSSNHYMMVGHVSEQYAVRPGKEVEDDALAKLAERMAAASRGVHEADMIIKTVKDPELQKRQAEQAEKERMKAQRRRETTQARQEGGAGAGARYGRSGGAGALSIGDLEGRKAGGGSRKRGASGVGAGGRAKRRRPEYDSDDDLPSGARRAGDDYDLGDDFIAPSDEDLSDEGGGDDDDDEEEEEVLDDEDEDEAPRKKRRRSVESEDEDAEGDLDDEVAAESTSRARRRPVIHDEDDE
ncbi:hypothetical protein SODALDRAFT_352106 [Sodiomyces alkalinus F11]|uniref:Leo1-domain-containing protein n=1 Tax=Sodiomyces alkalinus (strain CBS 110278 / VKM F-3762 / F11) TaxID=1314773 RepID=A0A3N2PQT6_SODAK|nr:hypothetical protein SODALDRAFT_352106 [Sodiomyces alkalinus F11]ROT36871.1 hypothetical protein SODALDRAFT_352106 [Sodiomyces alkalinus F11]